MHLLAPHAPFMRRGLGITLLFCAPLPLGNELPVGNTGSLLLLHAVFPA